jgi:hypothetical protein
MVMNNRVFLYGDFVERTDRVRNKNLPPPPAPPPSLRPSIAIEILREFSSSELIGKIYVQTRDQNWQPVSPLGLNSYDWFSMYRNIQKNEQSTNQLYFQTPEKDYWEVLYFRQESDESGAYVATALRHKEARYVVIPLSCSHCNTKQVVHISARSGFSQMGFQIINCINCKEEIEVVFPGLIVDGPFLSK